MIFGKFKLKTSKDEIRNGRYITIYILLCRGKNRRIKLKKKKKKPNKHASFCFLDLVKSKSILIFKFT